MLVGLLQVVVATSDRVHHFDCFKTCSDPSFLHIFEISTLSSSTLEKKNKRAFVDFTNIANAIKARRFKLICRLLMVRTAMPKVSLKAPTPEWRAHEWGAVPWHHRRNP